MTSLHILAFKSCCAHVIVYIVNTHTSSRECAKLLLCRPTLSARVYIYKYLSALIFILVKVLFLFYLLKRAQPCTATFCVKTTRGSWRLFLHFDLTRFLGESESVTLQSKLDSDRSRSSDIKPIRVSIIVLWTLSLHDVCLNRLVPLKLRMMSYFVTESFYSCFRCFKLFQHGRCLAVAAPSQFSVVRYKIAWEAVCCESKAIAAVYSYAHRHTEPKYATEWRDRIEFNFHVLIYFFIFGICIIPHFKNPIEQPSYFSSKTI